MIKFGRNYRLTIDMNDGGGAIVITPPFTIEFTVNRTAQATLNTMSIRIYNLSAFNRNRIRQDRYNLNPNHSIKLEAGYDNIFTIFNGIIMQADSQREGSNIVTTVISQDGGFDVPNTQISTSFSAGTSFSDVFKYIVGNFPNLTLGAIGDFDGKFNRSVVLDDNNYEALKKYAPTQVFIDKQKVFILQNNEVISGEIPVIDSSTGLLQTPRRLDAYLTIQTIFEPRVTVGQILELHSSIEPIYDGQYKVVGVNHQGMISGSVCGDLQSTFSLLLGAKPFGALKTIATAETTKPA